MNQLLVDDHKLLIKEGSDRGDEGIVGLEMNEGRKMGRR